MPFVWVLCGVVWWAMSAHSNRYEDFYKPYNQGTLDLLGANQDNL